MFRRTVKIAPEEVEESSTILGQEDSSDSDTLTPSPRADEKGGKKWATRFAFDWDECIQDLDNFIAENSGSKSSLYILDGEPLKRSMGLVGVHVITAEVIKAFGLEFLKLIMEAVVDVLVDRKIPLKEMVGQMQFLDYHTQSEERAKKLIIWVDDEPTDPESDPDALLGRLLLTEMLRHNIEPQIVLPCHDLDEQVLVQLIKTVQRETRPPLGQPSSSTEDVECPPEDEAEAVKKLLLKLFKIALSLSLASLKTNIILIDADNNVTNDVELVSLVEFAEQLGHKIIYLRNNPSLVDKTKAITGIMQQVLKWKGTSSSSLMDTMPATVSEEAMKMDPDQLAAENAKSLIEQDLGE